MTVSLKDAAPSWAKSLYRGSRLGVRRLRRLLGGDKVRCRVRGTEILLGVSSEIEQYRAETYASKEPETLDWLDKNLRDGDVLFDVGSNIGVYSLYAAKRQPGCRVYAFEPAAQNFSRLCRNLALNGLENVTPCNFPLSDKEAFERFFVSDLEAGSAFHSIGSFNPDQPAAAAQRLVQGVLAATRRPRRPRRPRVPDPAEDRRGRSRGPHPGGRPFDPGRPFPARCARRGHASRRRGPLERRLAGPPGLRALGEERVVHKARRIRLAQPPLRAPRGPAWPLTAAAPRGRATTSMPSRA